MGALIIMNKTKKLTQGAMLLAIVGAVMLIDRQLSFAFEYFVFMAAPVIIIIYTSMYDLKDGGILSFGLLAIGLLFGSTLAYFYIPLGIVVGLSSSVALKKNTKRSIFMIICMLSFVIGEIVYTLIVMPLLGIDISTQIAEGTTFISEMGLLDVLKQFISNINMFITAIFFASIIITGIMEGFFTYFLSIILLKRLKIKDVGISGSDQLIMSPTLAYILFINTGLMFVVVRFQTLMEKYELLSYIIIILSLLSSVALFYYGYIFITIYFRIMFGKRSFFISLLAVIFLFPTSYIILIIIGFLYGAGPLRAYLDKSKITKNENEKD